MRSRLHPFITYPAIQGLLFGCVLAAVAQTAIPNRATSPAPYPPSDNRLRPVPSPDLSSMESPVQHQIRDAQARLANAAGSSKRDLSLAYGALGEVYQVYAVYDAAVAAYTDAHVLDPAEFKWPYYLGYLFQTKGDLPNALANYTIALT